MAQTTALKTRIKSVKNTRQITKAMELVSASKMRRSQEAAARSRDFSRMANELLERLSGLTDISKHPLMAQREVKNRLYIVITSDRGLAGAYNSNVLRRLTQVLKEDTANGINAQLVTIGSQGTRFAARLKDVEVLAVYKEFAGRPTAEEISPLLGMIIEKFSNASYDEVVAVFTDYISSVRQEVTLKRLLPAAVPQQQSEDKPEEVTVFEPTPQAVLNNVTERFVEVQLAQVILEAQASEHSMRMMAMKNASDNASELIDDLTLAFNTARQAGITQEIAEITGGAEAIAA